MNKIAIIGHGMMGVSHIEALRALGYSPSIVMGRDLNRVRKFATDNNILKYTINFDDLIKEGINVVHICTPPMDHFELVKKSLISDMHVICEKPFVFNEHEGKELIALANENKLINAIGFNVRYHNICSKTMNMIKGKKLGDILLINGSYMQEFHALPSFYSWRYQTEKAGKFLATTEIGSHWIDTLRYITGYEVKSVSATYGRFFPDRYIIDGLQYPVGKEKGQPFHIDSDNVVLTSFKLSNGALANMVLSEITQGRYNYLDMTITGSKGSIWWDTENLNRLHIGKKNSYVEEEVMAFGGGFNSSVLEMLRDVYRDIQTGIRSSESKYASFSDGLANVKICNAIFKSANNNSKWEDIE